MNKQLFRSKKNRIFGGVAGGLGEYFELDPVVIRIIFVISLFAWGAPIFIYFMLWILIPENKEQAEYYFNDNEDTTEPTDYTLHKRNKNFLLGGILILFGLFIFLNNILPAFRFHYFWPLFLILIGTYIIYRGTQSHNHGGANETR